MLISETGSQASTSGPVRMSRPDLGMTLIEVLLVVFLVGLATTLVVMTLPDRARPDEARVEQFVTDLKQMRREAIYFGQPVGVRFDGESYAIVGWVDGAWQVRRRSDEERAGQGFRLADPGTSLPAEGWPDYVFDPTGVGTAVRIHYSGQDADYSVWIAADGEVGLEAS